MRQVWESWGPVLVVWAVGIALMPVVVALLARWQIRTDVPRRIAVRRSVIEVGVVAGTLPWAWMILTPTRGVRAVSLVPLRDIAATVGEVSVDTVVQIGANIAVFLPLGFLLPLRFPRFAGVLRMAVLGAVLSAALEVAQYVLDLGRVSSVDDVLMNAAGAGIGAALARVWRTRPRGPRMIEWRDA
ncbi:hypothetical protein BJY24_006560 [Nocardia transvalensis]|uniref:VanZ-like domain-containing protein n=1 Tax=Nocardia transvalensis TaxID=37333 RepID=A0A7W9PLF5_9NOCA|nr:VanZ family protein [Nocardia transvalensis]MBB5917648.1 hypothetical protein [Nocardia transvalensis]